MEGFIKRDKACLDVFRVVHRDIMRPGAVFNQNGVTCVVHDGWIWEHLADYTSLFAGVSRFFAQLPQTGIQGQMIGSVHNAPWDFQLNGVGSMAKLFNHYQMSVWRKGNYVHPVGTVQHDKFIFNAISRGYFFISPDTGDGQILNVTASKQFPGLNHKRVSQFVNVQTPNSTGRHGFHCSNAVAHAALNGIRPQEMHANQMISFLRLN